MVLGFRECLGCWEEGGEIADLNQDCIMANDEITSIVYYLWNSENAKGI